MRVSASSSFLIATLAISTSTPCLGAPTVDQQGDRLSTFNSARDLSARPGGEVTATGPPQAHAELNHGRSFDARELQRRGLLKSLLGGLPLIGPLVAGVDDTLCGGASGQAFGAESVDDSGPTEEQMVQMMEAAYTLSSVFNEATKATPLHPASSTANAVYTATSTTETSTETSTTGTASTESAMATPMSAESDSDWDSRILVAPDSLPASSTITSTSTLATETSTERSESAPTSTTPASTVVAQDVTPTPPSQLPSTPVGPNVKVPAAAPNAPVSPPGVPATPPKVPVDSSQTPVNSPVANLPANAPNPSLNAPADAQPPVSLPDGAQPPNAPIHPELPNTPANGPVAQAPIP